MKKLKLNLEDLKVESFETTNSQTTPKGTVNGQASGESCDPSGIHYPTCELSDCVVNTCDIVWECRHTNQQSCGAACGPTQACCGYTNLNSGCAGTYTPYTAPLC